MGHNASGRAFPKELTERTSVRTRFPFLNCLGIALAALLVWPTLARGQQPHPQSEGGNPGETIRVQSNTVLVDVVVEDKKGRAIRNLARSDFELYEDGVLQQITTVFGPGANKSADRGSETSRSNIVEALGAPQNSSLQRSFVAIVINSLSSKTRGQPRSGPYSDVADGAWVTAWDTARDYVRNVMSDNTLAGIFLIDLDLKHLKTFQFFTPDRGRLLQAIARARVDPAAVQSDSIAQVGLEGDFNATIEGRTMTDAFLQILNALRILPGRKSILFISREGVPLPTSIVQKFWKVLHLASQSNVAIYTIDAAGLRLRSTGSGVAGMREPSLLIHDEPMLRRIERAAPSLRDDPHYSLNVMARETGGLFIRDTNDIQSKLPQLEEDMHSYYLLAYTPRNLDFDGRFREIEVKVDAPGATVRARQGYYAVSAAFQEPLLEYEAPAIALLQKGETRDDLPVRSTILSFPSPGRPGLVAVLVGIDSGAIAYRDDKDGRVNSDLIVVTLFRNAKGEMVRKVSQQYRLSHEADKEVDDSILFYNEVPVPPGRYTVEMAAFDAVDAKAATEHNTLVVPEADPTLPSLSSLVVVQRSEPIGEKERGSQSPLEYKGTFLYPLLGDRWHPSGSSKLPFYFSIHRNGSPAKQAIIELSHYAQSLGRTTVELPAPDSEGRIQYLGTLPLADHPPGLYTLRVAIPAGDKVVTRSRRFFLVP